MSVLEVVAICLATNIVLLALIAVGLMAWSWLTQENDIREQTIKNEYLP